MPEQFEKQEGNIEQEKTQEKIKILEQDIKKEQTESQKQIEDATENLPQKAKQQKKQIEQVKAELSKKEKEKLENIKTLSPKEQIDVLVQVALNSKKEKNICQRVLEIAKNLDNPAVLDSVHDKLAGEMEELIEEQKITEI